MPRFILRLTSMPLLAMLAVAIAVAGFVALTPGTASAQGPPDGKGSDGDSGITTVIAGIADLAAQNAAETAALAAQSEAETAALTARIDDLQEALEAVLAAHDSDLKTKVDNHDTALGAVAAQTASIFAHANPDPFEVTLNTCMSLDGGLDIGLASALEIGVEFQGGIGIDFFGNGIRVEARSSFFVVPPPPALPLPIVFPNYLALQSNLGATATLSNTVCYQGVRVPFEGTFGTLQPDGTPKTHKAIEQAYIDSAEFVAKTLQNPTLLDAVDKIGLDAANMGTVIAGIVDLIPAGLEISDRDEIAVIAAKFADLAAALPLVGNLTFDGEAAEAAFSDPCAGLDIDLCQNPFDASAVDLDVFSELPDLIDSLFLGATTFAANAVADLSASTAANLAEVSTGLSNSLASPISIVNNSLSIVDNTLSNLNTLTASTESTLDGLVGFVNAVDARLNGLAVFVNAVDAAGKSRLNDTIGIANATLEFMCNSINVPVDIIRGISIGSVEIPRIEVFPRVHIDPPGPIHEHIGPYGFGPRTLFEPIRPFEDLSNIPCPGAIPTVQ